MKAKGFLVLLALLPLVGCRLVLPEHPYYNAHETELLTPTASERWVYFYGDAMTVDLEGQPLALAPGNGGSPWAVPGALWVNGMPLWRELRPPVRPQVQAGYDPATGEMVVETRTALAASWYYDGFSWYKLGGYLAAGKTVVYTPKPAAPRFGNLTPGENRVIVAELEARARGRRMVVFDRAFPVFPRYRFDPAPWVYRRTSLRVQTELPYRPVVTVRPWRLLKSGGYAAYKGRTPLAYLACTQKGVGELWQLAFGNQRPVPPPPTLAPGHCLAGFFWGLKATGGYQVTVLSGRLEGKVFAVRLDLKKPAPGAIVTQALTSPFVLLDLGVRPAEVRFFDAKGRLLARAVAE